LWIARQGDIMKPVLLLLLPLGMLAGCAVDLDPPRTAVVVSPPVVAAAPLFDSDADGVADVYDRYPRDWRYR
jgi:hypothetical protein